MNELTRQFYAFAREKRVDLLGVAPIERFEGVPAEHHPASIFPETRTVVVVGKRIPRGALRGVEESTQTDIYGQYGLSWLRDRMLAITTIGLATWLEDQGWEACPLQDLPPEIPPSGVAVRPGLPPPNVMVDAREAAVRAGLGEIGYCGELLTPQFGPRQRVQMILTDAPLEPTPLCDTPICDQCGECARLCPLAAFQGEDILEICGKRMRVARLDLSACRRCRNGARANPDDPRGRPDRLAALCIRTCLDHLERAGRVTNRFAAPFRLRPAWSRDAQGNVRIVEENRTDEAAP